MSAFIVTTDNLHTVARDTIVMGRKLERNYGALATFYSLTSESESGVITDAARSIVLAAYPDTDPTRLTGKNKNDDQRWLDARTVRAGLVRAVKADSDDESGSTTTKNLLTREGKAATLEQVTAEWKAAQA